MYNGNRETRRRSFRINLADGCDAPFVSWLYTRLFYLVERITNGDSEHRARDRVSRHVARRPNNGAEYKIRIS